MARLAKTTLAGLSGAARRLALLALAATVLLPAPQALAGLANRSTFELSNLLPRSVITQSQTSDLRVTGASAAENSAIREAIDSLEWPVDTSAFRVEVTSEERRLNGAVAMYVFPTNVIYLRRSTMDAGRSVDLARILAHEIGHMTDMVYLDAGARARFAQLRGYPAYAEWDGAGLAWEGRPVEDFAEVFAVMDTPGSTAPPATAYGRLKNPAQLRSLVQPYLPGPARAIVPLRLATITSVCLQLVNRATADPAAIAFAFLLMAIYAVTGAMSAMRPLRPAPSRSRTDRAAYR